MCGNESWKDNHVATAYKVRVKKNSTKMFHKARMNRNFNENKTNEAEKAEKYM